MRLKLKNKNLKQIKNWSLLYWYPKKLKNSNKEQWQIKVKEASKLQYRNYFKNKVKRIIKCYRINKPIKVISWKKKLYYSRFFITGLLMKRAYFYNLSTGLSGLYLKKLLKSINTCKTKLVFKNYIYFHLKYMYRTDILLKAIGFSNSSFEIRNAVQYSSIQINNHTKIKNPSYELKLGDIITIKFLKSKFSFYQEISKRVFFKKREFNLFCEIDYYTRTVIMINSFRNILNFGENPQIFFKKFNTQRFISFLKKVY